RFAQFCDLQIGSGCLETRLLKPFHLATPGLLNPSAFWLNAARSEPHAAARFRAFLSSPLRERGCHLLWKASGGVHSLDGSTVPLSRDARTQRIADRSSGLRSALETKP